MSGNHLGELEREGFALVTEWIWRDGKLRLASLDWPEASGWLYAFVVEGEVRYIGLTTRVLRSRMDNYRDGPGDQNARLRGLIEAELEKGTAVLVYGRRHDESQDLGGEESRLIRAFAPPWNR